MLYNSSLDPYEVLGLHHGATTAQIKAAFKKGALRCHPDKAQDKNKTADEFAQILQAYEILGDDERRRRYDDERRRHHDENRHALMHWSYSDPSQRSRYDQTPEQTARLKLKITQTTPY